MILNEISNGYQWDESFPFLFLLIHLTCAHLTVRNFIITLKARSTGDFTEWCRHVNIKIAWKSIEETQIIIMEV